MDLESFYLLEVKDVKDIYIANNNVRHHAENPESPALSSTDVLQNHTNILGLFNIYHCLCANTVSIVHSWSNLYTTLVTHWNLLCVNLVEMDEIPNR